MSTDLELLRAWQAGDASSGNTLVKRHFASVCRFFRGKLGDEVADTIQQTFLDCVRHRDSIDETLGFRTFLFTVARRRLIDELRRRNRRPAFDPARDSIVDAGVSPSQAILVDEHVRLLRRALPLLPLDQQVTLELFYWEEMAGAQIASVLGVSPHTVRSRLARAKDALREKIAALADDPRVSHATAEHLDAWTRELGRAAAAEVPSMTDA